MTAIDAEEAVEDEQEERDDEQADERGLLRLLQRVLTERRRDVRALDLLELDRQRTGLEHEREVLRLPEIADVLDLRRPPPIPSESERSVESICGNDLISRSRTIAKCCGDAAEVAALPEPPCDLAGSGFSPFPVNAIVTIGWPNWSKSCRVPSALMSAPVISGIGFSALSGW